MTMFREKRFIFAVSLGVIFIFFLHGCSSVNEMQYDGKIQPVQDVEEIMADKLEVENPGLDLEVQIYQEND
jgi:hypothetical protein